MPAFNSFCVLNPKSLNLNSLDGIDHVVYWHWVTLILYSDCDVISWAQFNKRIIVLVHGLLFLLLIWANRVVSYTPGWFNFSMWAAMRWKSCLMAKTIHNVVRHYPRLLWSVYHGSVWCNIVFEFRLETFPEYSCNKSRNFVRGRIRFPGVVLDLAK